MKLQLTHSELCKILSKNIGTTVEAVEILPETPVENPVNPQQAQKPQPHNPGNLTSEQYGANKGYRLLDVDEIKDRTNPHEEIEICKTRNSYWEKNCFGDCTWWAYRTKLSREELAKLK